MNTKTIQENLQETIMQITVREKPETVNQLVQLVREAHPASEEQMLEAIVKLQNEKKLQLTAPRQQQPGTSAYLKTSASHWFWATITLLLATVATVFTIPETAYPLVCIRYALAAVFILWLPGYALTKALFPHQFTIKTNENNLDIIERTALSIGMSLALVPMVGLLLNYTPWGIRLTPIVLSLLSLTTILATIGIIRERQMAARAPLARRKHP